MGLSAGCILFPGDLVKNCEGNPARHFGLVQFGTTGQLFLRTHQTSISMRLGTGLAGAKLTFFSRLGATGRATNRQCAFLFGCHD
jgi:hypothetical protein